MPWLGVHVLTEFVYCPRAGLVEYARGSADAGDEIQREPWASLSFTPLYDLSAIQKAVERAKVQLQSWSVLSIVLLAAATASFFWLGVAWLLVALAAYLSAIRTAQRLLGFAELQWLLRQAESIEGLEPDPSDRRDQPVNWWSMIRAGFDSIPYGEGDGLTSNDLQLAGRPWRVLRRGSLRIPVFKKRHCGKPGGRELHPQHYVRICAYCRLIEESEGAESPYGIVLFDDSYDGVAINTSTFEQRMKLVDALNDSRDTILAAAAGNHPKSPSASLCKGCPTGKPRVHRPGESETLRHGVPLPVFGVVGRDGRTYHSPCGDHFRWLPLHERVNEKGLKEPSTEPTT